MNPAIGDNVLYVLTHGPSAGSARLGFITGVAANGKVSITCLPDAARDQIGYVFITTNVGYDENKTPGTWHRPAAHTNN